VDPRKLSELIPFLKKNNISAKKALSQNFLVDKNILENIINTARVSPGESILEIGPGPGGLTLSLLEAGAKVLAIEHDHQLASLLPKTLSNHNLTVKEDDILTTPLSQPMKVVANIPYHISTAIINRLAKHDTLYKEIYFTIQKDMAIRLCATQKMAGYNAFSLFTQYYFTPKIHFDIPLSCFYPKPKVTSALLSLKAKENKPLSDPTDFFLFVNRCFQKKRKMLRGIIKNKNLDDILAKINLHSTARPQELSLEDFLFIFRNLDR